MIILRHDVDDAFSTKNLFSTGLNYLRMKIGRRFLTWRSLGYLEDAERLFEREKSIGICSSWFFRTVTKPRADFRRELLKDGHEIGFHADRIRNESYFYDDLKYVSENSVFLGFTKHGSRGLPTPLVVGRGEVYDLELNVRRCKDSKMIYFSGNDVVPIDPFLMVNGIMVFPSVFWVVPGYMDDKFTADWLIGYQKDHDVVVLIHPNDAAELNRRIAESVDKIYDHCDEIVSFEGYLRRAH